MGGQAVAWRQRGRGGGGGWRGGLRSRVRVAVGRWPVGWWEGVFAKLPRGGFCENGSIFVFSLLCIEINLSTRVYL